MIENILLLSLGILISIVMGQMIIPKILLISLRKRLFDVPDERKVHHYPIPRLGGLTFFPTILFVVCIIMVGRILFSVVSFNPFTIKIACEILALFAGLTLLYIVGIGDDLVGVRYYKKLIIQIISASFFPLVGLTFNNFYGFLGIYALPPIISIILTIVLVVFITNSINLIDGIDGLASSISIIALGTFGLIFAIDKLWVFSLVAFAGMGVLIPFFIYNVFGNAKRGKKIFMGDTGSLTLGFILSFLVLKYCMYLGHREIPNYCGANAIALSILMVPCFDVVRVVIGRIRNGKSPFLPDKTHIHHKFIDMGFNMRRSLILIQCLSFFFIAITAVQVYFFHVNTNIVIALDILLWTVLNLWFSKIIKKKQVK